MQHPKADLGKRFLAVIIDSLLAGVVAAIPVVGGLVGLAYMLTRDSIVFELTKNEDWKNRSIGKKLMGLEVVTTDGSNLDLATSVKRNITLSLGNVIAIVPLIGWIIGGIVGFVVGLIELFLAISDSEGKRLGDRIGNTQVVVSDPTPASTGPSA